MGLIATTIATGNFTLASNTELKSWHVWLRANLGCLRFLALRFLALTFLVHCALSASIVPEELLGIVLSWLPLLSGTWLEAALDRGLLAGDSSLSTGRASGLLRAATMGASAIARRSAEDTAIPLWIELSTSSPSW